MTATLSPQAFVAKWRHVNLKERSAAQEHFIDLCRLIGHPTPAEADPTGQEFGFEAGATKSTGGNGFADVWKRGFFAWEYKGAHADLDKAYRQLQQYREALQNPPLLVVCDTDRIVIHTNFTNTVSQVHALALEDLLAPAAREKLYNVFYHPEAFLPHQTTAQVTQEAAARFGRLAEILRQYGEDGQQTARFLIRLLFCLFAEDVYLLPKDLFSRLVQSARNDPARFGKQLRQLFAAMATGDFFGSDEIAHFDGGLFDDDTVLQLDGEGLDILLALSKLDWSAIEPAILGTLFERSLDPAKRAQLGAHYTSRADILLVIEPVLMAPLRARWQQVSAEAQALAEKRNTAKGAPRAKLERQLGDKLRAFGAELGHVQILDPACGSGNFLYVALRQLLDLWKEVSALASALGLPLLAPLGGEAPHPMQLHGIEINPLAHELAQATIWIGYIQWLYENGFGIPRQPVLQPLQAIRLMDAILAYDAAGKPAEPEWPQADVIVGNPPFLGGNKIRQQLGDTYVEALFALYKDRVPAVADLVCYWFEKARAMIAVGRARRVGLLATSSIREGANRRVLARIVENQGIFMAWRDRPWVLDGADLRVSIVGFDDGSQKDRTLDGELVSEIHSDLTSKIDLTVARPIKENAGLCFMGPSAKGPLEIIEDTARVMLTAPMNINGCSNADVVRPVANAADLVKRPRRMWTIDFGLMTLEEAAQYELPFEFVKQYVYPIRSKNRRVAYAEKWWQYAEARPGMRRALADKSRYVATPALARHRIFVWVGIETLCNQRNLIFAREDDYFFGVLHSKPHELWSIRMGSWTGDGNDPTYTPTSCFETFPFPWAPGQEPQDDPRVRAIAAAARDLVEKRDRWLNPAGAGEAELAKRTLTNLYNQRPTWLELAHRTLDAAVLAAYGWPADLDDEEILERLLRLNLERAGP